MFKTKLDVFPFLACIIEFSFLYGFAKNISIPIINRTIKMKPIYSRLLDNFIFALSHPTFSLLRMFTNYFAEHTKARIRNCPDFSSEILYCEFQYYLASKQGSLNLSPKVRDNSDPVFEILDLLKNQFPYERLMVIDVGSGPISHLCALGDIKDEFDITAIDPLASFYNQLNAKYSVVHSINCLEGTGENLNTLVKPESYHLVYSRNAIDHAQNPSIFVKNLFSILKPNGFLYISGAVKEGDAADWIGLHQHNLSVKNDDILWTNKTKSITDMSITEDLAMKVIYKEVKGNKPGDLFTIVYQKKELCSKDARPR